MNDKVYVGILVVLSIAAIVILALVIHKNSKEKYSCTRGNSSMLGLKDAYGVIQVFTVGTATVSNNMWYVSEGAYAVPSAPSASNYHCATSISAATSVVPASLMNVKSGDKLVLSLVKPDTDYISAKVMDPPGKIAETLAGNLTITNKGNAVAPYFCGSAMAMQVDSGGNIVTNMVISSSGVNEDGDIKNPNSKLAAFFDWIINAKEGGMMVYLYRM